MVWTDEKPVGEVPCDGEILPHIAVHAKSCNRFVR